MKKLFLVRHAKSDWHNSAIKDIERPLNERGYSNANQMSENLTEIPDLIISSPAIRAISTALIFARNIKYKADHILIKEELYEASVNNYLSVIHSLDDRYQSVMLFAHNPTISYVADYLLKNTLPMEMPTCTVAGIRFEENQWKNIKSKKGELFLFDFPKKN